MMNQDERKQVARAIILTAKGYDKNIDHELASMMVDDVCDLSVHDVLKALTDFRLNPKNKFAPRSADIRSAITGPPMDDEAEAQAAVGQIFEAIRVHGYMHGDRARTDMGELAWAAVEAFGGWYHFCTSDDLGSQGTIRAQLRDFCEAALLRARQGRTNVAPGMGLTSATTKAQIEATARPDTLNRISDLASKSVKSLE
jgi:hypothetical protein